jgi:hypothetical protein
VGTDDTLTPGRPRPGGDSQRRLGPKPAARSDDGPHDQPPCSWPPIRPLIRWTCDGVTSTHRAIVPPDAPPRRRLLGHTGRGRWNAERPPAGPRGSTLLAQRR